MHGMHKIRLLSPIRADVSRGETAPRRASNRGYPPQGGLLHSPHAATTTEAQSPSAAPAALSTILIIDDSPTIREIVEMHLRCEGYGVVSFANGVEALQWLTHKARIIPSLVLLDIGLPKLDGYEIARILRTKPTWKSMVIVIMSQYDSVIDRLKGRLAGADAYLTKPFTPMQLVELVYTHLDENMDS